MSEKKEENKKEKLTLQVLNQKIEKLSNKLGLLKSSIDTKTPNQIKDLQNKVTNNKQLIEKVENQMERFNKKNESIETNKWVSWEEWKDLENDFQIYTKGDKNQMILKFWPEIKKMEEDIKTLNSNIEAIKNLSQNFLEKELKRIVYESIIEFNIEKEQLKIQKEKEENLEISKKLLNNFLGNQNILVNLKETITEKTPIEENKNIQNTIDEVKKEKTNGKENDLTTKVIELKTLNPLVEKNIFNEYFEIVETNINNFQKFLDKQLITDKKCKGRYFYFEGDIQKHIDEERLVDVLNEWTMNKFYKTQKHLKNELLILVDDLDALLIESKKNNVINLENPKEERILFLQKEEQKLFINFRTKNLELEEDKRITIIGKVEDLKTLDITNTLKTKDFEKTPLLIYYYNSFSFNTKTLEQMEQSEKNISIYKNLKEFFLFLHSKKKQNILFLTNFKDKKTTPFENIFVSVVNNPNTTYTLIKKNKDNETKKKLNAKKTKGLKLSLSNNEILILVNKDNGITYFVTQKFESLS